MKTNFLSIAHIELVDAIRYLNVQSEGLGFEFANEVRNTIKKDFIIPAGMAKIVKKNKKMPM